LLEGTDNVLLDQKIRLTGYQTKKKYPGSLRRIVYYAPELKRTFTFLTNNFVLKACDIALLYKQRWQVELFKVDKAASSCNVLLGQYRERC
jgi:IS4 transposase